MMIVKSAFDKLCKGSFETLSIKDPKNHGVHEHGQVGEATQPQLEEGARISARDQPKYGDIEKSMKDGLILQSHEVGSQL